MGNPEVVTYRLESKMVYVTPASNYEQAIDFAQKEFADELSNIKRNRISFSVLVHADRTLRSVRIGAMAWPAVVGNLKTYEIIDVHVQPEVYVQHVDGPPGYHIATGAEEESKEAAEFFARSTPERSRTQKKGKPSDDNITITKKSPSPKRSFNPLIRLK